MSTCITKMLYIMVISKNKVMPVCGYSCTNINIQIQSMDDNLIMMVMRSAIKY